MSEDRLQWPSGSDLPNHREKLETEIKNLRDQLSKERELTKVLTQEVADLRVSNSLLIDNESKERKMRKELVDCLKECRGIANHYGMILTTKKIELLVKKASELDKTLT